MGSGITSVCHAGPRALDGGLIRRGRPPGGRGFPASCTGGLLAGPRGTPGYGRAPCGRGIPVVPYRGFARRASRHPRLRVERPAGGDFHRAAPGVCSRILVAPWATGRAPCGRDAALLEARPGAALRAPPSGCVVVGAGLPGVSLRTVAAATVLRSTPGYVGSGLRPASHGQSRPYAMDGQELADPIQYHTKSYKKPSILCTLGVGLV
jgi:hypothetical protein